MSHWRSQVSSVEWRYRLAQAVGMIVFVLEALDGKDWEMLGEIDMDRPEEDYGESIAREIVEAHNARLKQVIGATTVDLASVEATLFRS